MLIYSGHDGRLLNHNPNELDKQTDEIWYLYDMQLVDDELNNVIKLQPDLQMSLYLTSSIVT
jgi:hypothetical protein